MKTAFIVDDNPLNAELMRFVLEAKGWAVHVAVDAEEAQVRLGDVRADVILMDLSLPGIDGLELTRRLKADPSTRAIPIVAVTASAMKGDDARARDAGCDGYITKPIDTRRFAGQLEELLEARRPT